MPGCRPFGYKTASGRARWLSRDPIGENGGINLYGYVSNNPLNAIDPLGLVDLSLFGGDPAGRAAAGFNPAGFYSVGAHGNPSFIADQRNQKPNKDGKYIAADAPRMSPKQLADLIRAQPDYSGQPIFLVSCSTGGGGKNSFAQKLANELGVDVTAPTADGVVKSQGNTDGRHTGEVWIKDGPGAGSFRIFSPK